MDELDDPTRTGAPKDERAYKTKLTDDADAQAKTYNDLTNSYNSLVVNLNSFVDPRRGIAEAEGRASVGPRGGSD